MVSGTSHMPNNCHFIKDVFKQAFIRILSTLQEKLEDYKWRSAIALGRGWICTMRSCTVQQKLSEASGDDKDAHSQPSCGPLRRISAQAFPSTHGFLPPLMTLKAREETSTVRNSWFCSWWHRWAPETSCHQPCHSGFNPHFSKWVPDTPWLPRSIKKHHLWCCSLLESWFS